MDAIKKYAGDSQSLLEFSSVSDGAHVKFYAFLTSFSQAFASTWNSEVVYGRNDPIATFQGTQRTLNLAWDIPAANITNAQENMDSISTLIQMLYPSYTGNEQTVEVGTDTLMVGSNALTLSKAPLIRINFANLITGPGSPRGLLGFVSNVGINPLLDMGMFTDAKKLFPKVYSLTLDFTVLHEHPLGPGANTDWDQGKYPFQG